MLTSLRATVATDIHTPCNVPTYFNPVFIVTGDFDSFHTDFIEVDFGLSQLVTVPTHGNNIIDEYFELQRSLIVTIGNVYLTIFVQITLTQCFVLLAVMTEVVI
jgi:hypothetical protein